MILTRKPGYAVLSSGNTAVKDISPGYVSVSREFFKQPMWMNQKVNVFQWKD